MGVWGWEIEFGSVIYQSEEMRKGAGKRERIRGERLVVGDSRAERGEWIR